MTLTYGVFDKHISHFYHHVIRQEEIYRKGKYKNTTANPVSVMSSHYVVVREVSDDFTVCMHYIGNF